MGGKNDVDLEKKNWIVEDGQGKIKISKGEEKEKITLK